MMVLVLQMQNQLVIRLDTPTVAFTIPLIWVIHGRNLKSRFRWMMLNVSLLQQIFYHAQAVLMTTVVMKMFFSHVLHRVSEF